MKTRYWKILKLMLEENKILSLLWLFFSVIIGLFPSLSVLINRNLVNQLETIRNGGKSNSDIVLLLILILIVAIVTEIFKNIANYIYLNIKYNISFRLEKVFYKKILKYPLEKFEDTNFYNNVLMASQALETNSIDIIVLFISSFSNIITLFSVIIILIAINWKLPIILFLASIPSALGIVLMKKYKYVIRESLLELTRKAGYYVALFTDKKSIRDIKLFCLKDYWIDVWSGYKENIIKKAKQVALREGVVGVCGQVIINVSIFAATFSLVNMVIEGSIDLGGFVSLLTAVTLFQGTVATISENSATIYETGLYVDSLFAIIESIKEGEVPEKTYNLKNIKNESIDTINFVDVSFKYKQAKDIVLKDINININKGEKIAIVGYNGAGKSTLINLLLGLYKPDRGKILVNGVKMEEIDLETFYSKISCISQDFTRYDFSLFENIALNRENTAENREMVTKILRDLDFDKKKLEHLDDSLSAKYSGGFELSGGEWQKVAIARAIIRDADLVVFDEPTSALDPIAEVRVYNDLYRMAEDKTLIVISHRLGITKLCDKIIMMKEGRIVEIGSHEELMSKNGEYAHLYGTQASWYCNY